MYQDSTGRPIKIGDRVRWRGQEYTIKAFAERNLRTNVNYIEFEEPLHLEGERPYEFTVDRL